MLQEIRQTSTNHNSLYGGIAENPRLLEIILPHCILPLIRSWHMSMDWSHLKLVQANMAAYVLIPVKIYLRAARETNKEAWDIEELLQIIKQEVNARET